MVKLLSSRGDRPVAPTKEGVMRITYDSKADAMYIKLKEGPFARNEEIKEGIILDLGPEDELLGIEILEVSLRYSLKEISHLDIEMPLVGKEKQKI